MNSLVFEHNIECVMNYIKEHKNLPYEIIDIELRSIVEALFYQSLEDYRKTLKENQQLKKQKDDVVEYIKEYDKKMIKSWNEPRDDLLRMLGEIDVED